MRDLVDELLQAKVKTRLFGGDHAPRLGRLVLLDRIGSGAMGTVFAAYDPRLDRKVAAKVLRAPDEARVLAEARALARLTHPNVVAVHDTFEHDGAVVVVMELVTGVPLRAWIGPVDRPRADIVRVIRDTASGLAAAHHAGLIHRDVKPDNILVGADRTRVVDFGIARAVESDAGDELAGTPSYMAPELLAGDPATEASDQFALGVTFYEALYGERPHAGATRGALVDSSRTAQAAALARPASWERAIIARLLAPDPDARFSSLDAVIAELDRDRVRRRRRRVLAITVPALVVVVAAISIALVTTRTPGAADLCSGTERLSRTWSTSQRPSLPSDVLTRLDATAQRWQTSFRRVCEATRVQGEQSDALLELRMRCLDRALGRFDALIRSSTHAKWGDVMSAIAELPDSSSCESLTDSRELALPSDPARRAEAIAAEHELDAAWASYATSHYADARTQVAAIDARTRTLEAPALLAQVRVLAASIEARTGTPPAARAALDAALDASARAGVASLEADVWARLLRHELFSGDPAHVVEWSSFAHAAATRAGLDGAELDAIVGQALRDAGQLSAARTHLRRALASHDPLRGDQHALIEMNLGAVELAAGNPEVAAPLFTSALADAAAVLGQSHPSLAIYLDKLAAVDRARGDTILALTRSERSLALRTAAFGPDDRSIATSLLARADTLRAAGRFADAAADLDRARAIRTKVYGTTSSRMAEIDASLAELAAAEGRVSDARTLYLKALDALGPAPTLARLRLLRGLAKVDATRADEARQLADKMPDVN